MGSESGLEVSELAEGLLFVIGERRLTACVDCVQLSLLALSGGALVAVVGDIHFAEFLRGVEMPSGTALLGLGSPVIIPFLRSILNIMLQVVRSILEELWASLGPLHAHLPHMRGRGHALVVEGNVSDLLWALYLTLGPSHD